MDKRNEKSKESIRQALIRLSRAKPYSEISVRELCREAHVSRSTFYNNYRSGLSSGRNRRKMDISKRPLRMFNMFSGKEKTVKMRFANYLANVVLDRFGKDAILAYEDEKHFTFSGA